MVFTRENEKTKEELLKEIEELHQIINDLEKLQNKSQNVNEETEQYLDLLKRQLQLILLNQQMSINSFCEELTAIRRLRIACLRLKGTIKRLAQ